MSSPIIIINPNISLKKKKTDCGPTILDGLPAAVYSQALSHDCWTWGLWLARFRASVGSTFLRRPGGRDSSASTMSMPSFVRTLDQHRTTTNRTPARKSFTQLDPRSSSGYRKTPRFPVVNNHDEAIIYTEFSWYGAITSILVNYGKYLYRNWKTSIDFDSVVLYILC